MILPHQNTWNWYGDPLDIFFLMKSWEMIVYSVSDSESRMAQLVLESGAGHDFQTATLEILRVL